MFEGLEKSQALIKRMQDIMNTSPVIQAEMDKLAARAEELNLSKEQWTKAKEALFAGALFKLMLEHEDIKNIIVDEMGRKIWNEAHAQ